RVALRRLVRPRADGILGARLLGAGVRARLPPDLARVAAARLVPGAGLPAPRRRFLAVPAPSHPALDHALGDLHRADRESDARLGAGSAGRGLHPHCAGQGPARAARAGAPCARQCGGADRHRDRHRHRHPDRRRGGDGVGLRDSRARTPDGRRGARARLPHHPGRDPLLLVHLCGDQPADRPFLRLPRSQDPLLKIFANWSVRIGGTALAVLVLIAVAAPWLGSVDPTLFDAASRDLKPGASGEIMTLEGDMLKHTFLMGSDSFGRDIYSRVLYDTRVSLMVGLASALVALSFGIVLGLCAGYIRWLDGLLMRVMDGIMAIPAILIAIAVVALWRASLPTVIVAIAIPEIPRVTRLVRALVLSIREEPYVEAAVALGTPTPKIMFGHILPNTAAPLLAQGTYICAFAILLEAILSFLGVGLPPDIPTWGNIMAEGRVQFVAYPHNVFFPGVFLAVTVLAVNMLGDGLRDTLDPKMARRL